MLELQRTEFSKFGNLVMPSVYIRNTGAGFIIEIMCFVWDAVRWKCPGMKVSSRQGQVQLSESELNS